MNKIILSTIAILFFTMGIQAQITVTRSDFPSRGDVFFIMEDDDMSGLSAGGSGLQTWNFQSLDVTNLDTIVFVEPSQTPPYRTPFDTLFPGSNLALSGAIEGAYLKANNDSLMLDGVAADLLGQGFVTPIDIDPDLKIIEFPSDYQDGFTSVGVVDTTIDTLILGGIIDSVRVLRTQTNTVSFGAYGTLNLPNGSYQTLRMYTKEETVSEVFLHNTITGWPSSPDQILADTVYRYNWIAKNEGYYVMEATADISGNLISGFFKSGAQVFGFPSQLNTATCYGACDGAITIQGVGGTGSYSYQWSANAGGGTSTNVSGLCAGDYIYTITDQINSSTYIDTVTITEPDSISISATLVKESNLGNDGEINLTISGGTAPYSYAWTGTNQTTKDVNSLTGGTYSVTVTDANNCSVDTTIVLGSRVGLNELSERSFIHAYPNPANQTLTIKSDLVIEELRLLDILRKPVLTSRSTSLNTSEISEGVYLLEVSSSNSQSELIRVIIKH